MRSRPSKHSRQRLLALAVGSVSIFSVKLAQANIFSTAPSGVFDQSADYAGSVGTVFTPLENITVTQVGYYDPSGTPLATDHQVGFFDYSSGATGMSPPASPSGSSVYTVPGGSDPALSNATYSNGFEFIPVTPFTLSANTAYEIVAQVTLSSDGYLYYGYSSSNTANLSGIDPAISNSPSKILGYYSGPPDGNTSYLNGAYVYPSHYVSNTAYFGGNFTFATPPSSWAADTDGNWNTASNWAGAVPNGAGVEADLFSVLTTPRTLFTDTPITLGVLNFNSSYTYQITGNGSLTMQSSTSSPATVIVQAGTQEINLPLIIASKTIFNVSSGATLLIANPLTILAGENLSSTGLGNVTYQAPITVQTGGSITFGSNSTIAPGLALAAASSASVSSTGGKAVLQFNSISLAPTSQLDLGDSDMIIHDQSVAAVTGLILQGYAGGSWNGSGIVSSAARNDAAHLTALGVTANNNGGGTPLYTSFGGQAVSSTDVLVGYTYYGDTNLKGYVDGSDYSRIDNAYTSNLTHPGQYTGWFNGDFNYDGRIDGSDYTLIDNAFNQQGTSLTALIATPSVQSTAQIAGVAASAVPEPTSFGLAGLGALSLLVRRRRN